MDLTINSINEMITICQKFVKEKDDWNHEEYGNNRDEILIRKYNTEILKNIPNKKRYLKEPDEQAEYFDDDLVNNLKFIQFRFQNRGQTVIFLRKFTKQRVLSHGKKLLRQVSGVLELTDDSIMEIPTDYDCCIYGNDIIIFHPDNFEDLFDYHEIHEEYYKTVFNHLEKKIDYKIEGLDRYKEQIHAHPQKLRKLPAIQEKEMYMMSFKDVTAFLKKRPTPSVIIDKKKKSIKFQDVFAMIHFYNDAHLTSLATGTNYLAQHKSIER